MIGFDWNRIPKELVGGAKHGRFKTCYVMNLILNLMYVFQSMRNLCLSLFVFRLDTCDLSNDCTGDCHTGSRWENSENVSVNGEYFFSFVRLQRMFDFSGGKICLTDHFQPLWARNVPRFGIAHALALGVRKFLLSQLDQFSSVLHSAWSMACCGNTRFNCSWCRRT